MIEQEAKNILDRYLKGMCSPEEILLIDSWYIYTIATSEYEVSEEAGLAIKQRVWNNIHHNKSSTPVNRSMYIWISSAAAVVFSFFVCTFLNNYSSKKMITPVIAASFLPGIDTALLTLADGQLIHLNTSQKGLLAVQHGVNITQNDSSIVYQVTKADNDSDLNTITTPNGGQYQIKLSDGSLAYLNPASTLTYPTRFTGAKRQVYLEGEAYFEITKNASLPFEVLSKNQITRVIGTHFTVSCYPNEPLRTILSEGTIEIINTSLVNHEKKTLKAGQQAIIDASGISITEVDPANATAWKDGLFYFNQTPLVEALHRISRWYDIKVDYNNIPDIKIEGFLPKNLPLEEMLKGFNKFSSSELILKDSTITRK